MIKSVYCVRDSKVGFLDPVCEDNDKVATRNFAYAVNHSNGIMGFAPSDFDLYRIGTFDTETSQLVSTIPPALVVSGSSVVGVTEDA